jgi:hypothetical protein
MTTIKIYERKTNDCFVMAPRESLSFSLPSGMPVVLTNPHDKPKYVRVVVSKSRYL